MRVLKTLACLGLLAGCSPWSAEPPAHPTLTRVAGVPFYPQEGFRCGPAAMAMVLDWSGLYVKPSALEAHFFTMRDPRKTLAETANRYGRLAYSISGTNAMMAELAVGHPVVVVQNLGVDSAPKWNCAVAVGFDREQGQILVHAGDQAAKRMSMRLFERLWADSDNWGLVVLRPGELPAAARQPDYVKAAYNLERAGRYWEAVLAYDAGLALWPNDPDTLMGLGSSLYLLGDPRGAADAYRAAAGVAHDPSPASAALAQISAELETVAVADKPQSKPMPKPLPRPARAGR
ncbi:MAG: PA2778 family cysteine peptidase [Rhodospirillaceae bacterium]|nr:PA2778 family cysteine peptidase [Rhodospirillales bacterium]